MRPFIFQNHSTRKPPGTVVIDFLSINGTFQLVYKKGNLYVPIEKVQDFTRASVLKINYGYLGGEHFCNYTMTKEGDRYKFVLNKAMLESGDFVWDINNAAFYVSQIGDSQTRGLSPIHDMSFEIIGGVVQMVEVNTFRGLALSVGLDYVVTWDTHADVFPDPLQDNQCLYYYNNGNVDVTFQVFKNWGLGLTTENPVLLNWRWKYNDNDIAYPLAFTYCAPSSGNQEIQMICRYTNSFNINNPTPTGTSSKGVCTMDNTGRKTGPANQNATYKHFINY